MHTENPLSLWDMHTTYMNGKHATFNELTHTTNFTQNSQ